MKNNSENKHTPGEWKFAKRDSHDPGATLVYTDEGDICEVTAPSQKWSHAEANAKHICKCVNSHDELVAALQKSHKKLSYLHAIFTSSSGNYQWCDPEKVMNVLKEIDSALQKAGIESLQKSSS